MLTQHDSSQAIERIAASLGIKADARRKWRERGRVPARWHVPIMERAKSEGLQLDLRALSDFRPSTAVSDTAIRSACHTRVGEGGTLVIPDSLMEAIGLHPGDAVILEAEGCELRLRPLKRAITDVRALVRRYVADDVNLVDELIAERRREAERE